MSTRANQAYNHIRQKLLDGTLSAGQRIRYGPIGKEIGMSATPVREAIGKLASEGLVELVPQLGAVVRTIGRDETIEIYQMREAMETFAAGWATERIGATQLQEMRSSIERMHEIARRFRDSHERVMPDPVRRRFLAADLEFHMLIVESAGNRWLGKAIGDFHILSRSFAEDDFVSRGMYDLTVVAYAYGAHRRILRAIQRGDAAAARLMMGRHIRGALALALAAHDRAGRNQWWRSRDWRKERSRIDPASNQTHRPKPIRRELSGRLH